MPAALPFVAGVIGSAFGWGTIAYIGTSVLVGVYQADRARKQLHRLQDQYDRGLRSVNIRSATSPRQLVLGTVRVFGVPAYAEFVGTNEDYLDQIIAFSNNQVTIGGVYFDDELVTAANIVGQAPTTGKFANTTQIREYETLVVSGSNTITLAYTPSGTGDLYISTPITNEYSETVTFSGTTGATVNGLSAAPGTSVGVSYNRTGLAPLYVQFALGTTSQASTSWGVSTPKWTANHRLRGMGYVRTLMEVDNRVYANGLPQVSVLASMASQVWDPRLSGGAGGFVAGSSNPALLAAWYRTLPRADGGMGIPTTWIDWSTVAAAANICDELITVKKLDGSGTEQIARYRCDIVLSLARSRNDNLRAILSSMAGDFPFTGGFYKCFAGAYRAPIYTVTDADVATSADIHFSPNAGDYQSPPNIMAATIFDAAKNYNETGAPEVVNSGYVSSDGAENIGEVDLPATSDSRRANYLQGVRLEQLRPAHRARVRLGGVAADLALCDAVQFDLSGHAAMSSFVFEIVKWTNNFNGTYDLELVQSKSSTWALDADRYTPVSVTAPPDLSYIWAVAKPASVSIASGATHSEVLGDGTRVSRLKVTWASHSQAYVRERGHIEIRWRRAGSNWIDEPPLPGAATEHYLKPITDAALYYVEVRATNPSGGFSEWTAPPGHVAAYTGNNEQDTPFVAHGTAGAVVLRGRSAIKVAADGAFNAGVRSTAPLRGGCRASWSVTGNHAFVVGLNTDPATDADYTGIDYAIRLLSTGSLVRIYESGTAQGSDGSFVAGDEFAIEYDNTAVRYYQNNTLLRQVGARPGITLYLDSSILTVGHKVANLAFGPLSAAPRGNLIDASTWVVGTTGAQGVAGGGRFEPDLLASECSIVHVVAPDNVLRPVWRATSGDAAGADRDGGFYTGEVPIDPTKQYQFSVWFKRVGGTSGAVNFGLSGTTASEGGPDVVGAIASGTANTTPFFVINPRADFVAGRWYLFVGCVLPASFGTTPPSPTVGGVYDGLTGQRVLDADEDFKWLSGAGSTYLRVFQSNCDSGDLSNFCWPRLEMCDGSEPSVDELLAMAKKGFTDGPAPDFEAQYGLNGQFHNWLLAASLPDGWASVGGTNSRETSITRTGPNAVRSVSATATAGIARTIDFGGFPLAEGSFVEGTLDVYLVSHTSGGYPGLRMRLYTNSGLSTQRDLFFDLPNTTTGGWQTIAFKASVNAGERIYGALPTLLSSHASLSGGNGVNTVIFDSLVMRSVQPSDTQQIVPGAATKIHQAFDAGPVTFTTIA